MLNFVDTKTRSVSYDAFWSYVDNRADVHVDIGPNSIRVTLQRGFAVIDYRWHWVELSTIKIPLNELIKDRMDNMINELEGGKK